MKHEEHPNTISVETAINTYLVAMAMVDAAEEHDRKRREERRHQKRQNAWWRRSWRWLNRRARRRL